MSPRELDVTEKSIAARRRSMTFGHAVWSRLDILAEACQRAEISEAHDADGQQRQEKLVRCVCTSPLDKDDVLDIVLSFVGRGEHLYVAGVNRRWRGKYFPTRDSFCTSRTAASSSQQLDCSGRLTASSI
jgi:hypothetical protein